MSETSAALLLAGNSDLWASRYRKAWDLLIGCATDFVDAGEPYDDLLDLPAPTPALLLAPGTITKSSNIRSGPGTSYKIVGAGKPGQEIEIYEVSTDKNWYRIGEGEWIASFLVDAG
ncbi:MAG: SH3 domain-containing protein [Caldilineaceae bacterium]